jgi:hypothetical protein
VDGYDLAERPMTADRTANTERLLRQALADEDVMMVPATLRRVAVRLAQLLAAAGPSAAGDRRGRSPIGADRTAVILGDVLRAALDDSRVKLGPRTERAVIERAAELLGLAGCLLVHSPPGVLNLDDEGRRIASEHFDPED